MSDNQDDDWLIDDTAEPAASAAPTASLWKVAIIDDEPDVHLVTKLALKDTRYQGRALHMISAYSGAEGFALLRDNPDTAIVLLDVVMETEDAGLRLVQRIRGELNNPFLRIILRTGQPGQAPEKKVITEYDINDYKAKTELTTEKLFTTVIASLRTYELLIVIEKNREGLDKILSASANLYRILELRDFASGVLKQISAILGFGTQGILCVMHHNRAGQPQLTEVVAATEEFETMIHNGELDPAFVNASLIEKAFASKGNHLEYPNYVLYIQTLNLHEFVVYFDSPLVLDELQCGLLRVFCERIAAAFDNLHLYNQLRRSQQATVVALADLAEHRDTDTGDHVQRVQRLTDAVVRGLQQRGTYAEQLSARFVELIGMASILHDIGKVTTPDHILFKPGQHSPEERQVMEQHAAMGREVLLRASRMVEGENYLSMAVEIAGNHHEHWDGAGYPQGLQGEAIPLSARIVAVVDVFDALMHERPYKPAWPLSQSRAYIAERAGLQFDPNVVTVLLDISTDTAVLETLFGHPVAND